MRNIHYHIRLPGPFEHERNTLEIIYYVLRIAYKVVLIVMALMVLGGTIA